MRDSARAKQSHAINFAIANIAHYNLILGMAWLQNQNPDIQWDFGVWHWRTRTDSEDKPIRLVSKGAFIATMRAECTHSYKLQLHELGLDPVCDPAGDVLMATGPELTGLELYKAYVQVFLEADSESMPSRGSQDLAIKLLDSKQPPWGPIYNLSKKELDTFYSYLEVQLKQGWIRPLKSPARAPVFFVPKNDGTLQLCVDF
jgi:hypothetical protein